MSVQKGKSFIKLTAGQTPRILMLKLEQKIKLELKLKLKLEKMMMLDLESVSRTKNTFLHLGSLLKYVL